MAPIGKTIAFVLACLTAGVVFGQKALRVNVDLVMVNASVVDSDNRLVSDLEPKNFRIFEDKVEQSIEYFSSETAPVSLGIVFDSSHSMQKKLEFARSAAVRFLETGTPDDEYFLVEFASRPEVASDFTTDIRRLRDELSFKPAQGQTALYDAMYLGLAKLRHGQNPKKALLLITDGEDNYSRYTRSDIRQFLRESDVQIYVIDLGRALLSDLADMTGGHSYRASVDDLGDVCEKIAVELKSQYVLGYKSTNNRKDGKFRRILVKMLPPPGFPKLHVRTRRGYYAAAN